ncbi:MAG: proline dehydrogenase family protein [Thermoproteota archaeon]
MVSVTRIMEKALFGFAKQWIAGDTLDDALRSARQTYKKKMNVIINKLGEYNTSKKIIAETVNEYQTILLSLKKSKIEGGISVKPTQVGLLVSKKECIKSFSAIIKTATLSNSFVWIDMESSDHTDEILEVYHKLFSSYERLGLALQANLKRTKNDLVDLLERGAKIRLVKGAYRESAKISYKSKDQVDENFLNLTKLLFKKGNEFGIATHDCKMIDAAVAFSKKYVRQFEFQMLKGIRDELKLELVKQKFSVSEYIPYGTNWLPYSIRRLKERKRNILLLGSSFIQSHRV